MIQQYSRLKVADNSGAKELSCIRVMGGRSQRKAIIGDTIICSVKKAVPRGIVKKKEVVTAIIVRQHAPLQRKDGSMIKFDDNAAVVINKDGTPRGSRVLGPIAREVKDKGFAKIASLAPEVI